MATRRVSDGHDDASSPRLRVGFPKIHSLSGEVAVSAAGEGLIKRELTPLLTISDSAL